MWSERASALYLKLKAERRLAQFSYFIEQYSHPIRHSQASQTAGIDLDHARKLVADLIETFRKPLEEFDTSIADSDNCA